MRHGFLRWFFLLVQFVMLAVSIPKVATLFHNYDPSAMGPLIGGVDIRSWLVGFAIDLTVAVTTWAALQKYEATGNRFALFAPGLIIAVCAGLSIVANYEDAALINPAQYKDVSLFTQPALLINPILISAPPLIVLMLILLVPSVLATPRIKSAAEIEAETEHEIALMQANARKQEIKAQLNAKVRGARLSGLVDTVKVTAAHVGQQSEAVEPSGQYVVNALPVDHIDPSERALPAPTARATKAMWKALSLKDRVLQSGIITATEVAEVLGISAAHARRMVQEVRTPDNEVRVTGRTGIAYQALIDALYAKRSKDSFAHAQKLEVALGLHKKTRGLHLVGDAADSQSVPLAEAEG